MITSGRCSGFQCLMSSRMNDNPGAWRVATGPEPEGAGDRGAPAVANSRAASIISGGAVHAANRGRWPALRKQSGQVSGPAAHVDDVSGKFSADPGEQVEKRSGALASKPQIKGRVPHDGQSLPVIYSDNADLIPLYMTGILDVKRYALIMGQRAGPRTEADSDDEILSAPLLRDEVDDLVAAWRAQRPDLDVEPMQVLSRISRLARHLRHRRGAARSPSTGSSRGDSTSFPRCAGRGRHSSSPRANCSAPPWSPLAP